VRIDQYKPLIKNMGNQQNSANVKQAVPFFMVANMNDSLAFYTKGLGFVLQNKWEPRGSIEWCWLQLDQVSLMLQEYRDAPPEVKRGEGVSVCFMCDDALSIYKELTSRGIAADEPFVGNNAWVVGIKDPDGYRIYFESPTDVPEETRYSDWIHR
jgi:lactoylglutathione lyase